MMLLVSGASRTLARLAGEPLARGRLGHLVVPGAGNRLDSLLSTGLPFACDNGCFKALDVPAYLAMLRAALPRGPEWVTVPDVVANAEVTVGLFDYYLGALDDREGYTPWALVAQDGMEGLDWDWWFGFADCLFIGGSTRWKLSKAAADLAREATRRGKWLHMGRVNSLRRLTYAFELGCDSVDGSGYSSFPDTNIPPALRHLARLEADAGRQPRLPFEAAAGNGEGNTP